MDSTAIVNAVNITDPVSNWIPIVSAIIAILAAIGSVIWAVIKFRDEVRDKANKAELNEIISVLNGLGATIKSIGDMIKRSREDIEAVSTKLEELGKEINRKLEEQKDKHHDLHIALNTLQTEHKMNHKPKNSDNQ
jgi:hypothetical protein